MHYCLSPFFKFDVQASTAPKKANGKWQADHKIIEDP